MADSTAMVWDWFHDQAVEIQRLQAEIEQLRAGGVNPYSERDLTMAIEAEVKDLRAENERLRLAFKLAADHAGCDEGLVLMDPHTTLKQYVDRVLNSEPPH